MSENNYKKLVYNTAIFAVGNFGSKILTFLIVPLYAAEISINAERCRTYKNRQEEVRLLQEIPSEENLWQAVIAFQDYPCCAAPAARPARPLPWAAAMTMPPKKSWATALRCC